MNVHEFESAISCICGAVAAVPKATLTSAVTTAWGVNWDETCIARDVMQNFFDANRNDIASIRVEEIGRTVIVRAPAAFNLERLFYLDSEKGADDVGQYGEGFKVGRSLLVARSWRCANRGFRN